MRTVELMGRALCTLWAVKGLLVNLGMRDRTGEVSTITGMAICTKASLEKIILKGRELGPLLMETHMLADSTRVATTERVGYHMAVAGAMSVYGGLVTAMGMV